MKRLLLLSFFVVSAMLAWAGCDTAEQQKQRRFAASVRSNQSHPCAGLDREVQVVQDRRPVERHAQLVS